MKPSDDNPPPIYYEQQYPQPSYPPAGNYPQASYPPAGSYPPVGPPPGQGYPGVANYNMGYQHPQPVVHQQPVLVGAPVLVENTVIFGSYPVHTTCIHCGYSGNTNIARTPGAMLWISVLILCCFCPILCCIPCCIPDCYDVHHYCSNCKRHIGSKQTGF